MKTSSPASTGPAGPLFEAQVGAHYLLSLLIGLEPRGLPGTRIERVEFQRAAEGHPLDDIVVHASDVDGSSAVLEIQVKRSLRFTLANREFRKVVAQIARASQKPGFLETRHHELAIAVEQAHLGVQGSYREVLEWARQLGSAEAFMARLERPHSANKDMRNFVGAFRAHLEHAGIPHDDETVWQLLSRLHILQFDFTAQDSAYETWSREQATRALHPGDERKAGALWQCLVALATRIAASGGDRDRARLVKDVQEAGFGLAGDRRYESVRSALAENAQNALEDISDRVGTVRLMRARHMAAIRLALDEGRYVEIRGAPGVGKSGLLKRLAEEISRQSPIIVLSPDRVTPGGWTAMRAALGFDRTARELLVDLAASGGPTLFIDGLESFSQTERRTVVDLVREAAHIPGFSVVVTVRTGHGGEDDEAEWWPADTLERIGCAPPVIVGELDADEVGELRDAAPELAPLLADAHPAKDIARNLFRLERLARQPGAGQLFRTEIDMAEDWWCTADGRKHGRRDRARLLRALAEQVLVSETLNAETHLADAVDALVESGTVRDLGGDRMTFRHDILRDWAVGNLLFKKPEIACRLPLDRPAPARLVRGFELAARMKLERGANDADWRFLLDAVSQEGMHGSWRRAVLLAAVRSEIGDELLSRVAASLLADDARLLIELIRTVKAVEVEPLSTFLAGLNITVPEPAASQYVPSAPSWTRLMFWLLVVLDHDLPEEATKDAAEFLLQAPSVGALEHPQLGGLLANWFYRRLEGSDTSHSGRSASFIFLAGFLVSCRAHSKLAARYLRSLTDRDIYDSAIEGVWNFSPSVAQAAPEELANLTFTVLTRMEDRNPDLGWGPFGSSDVKFAPTLPEHGPFLALLDHAPAIGLKLIRRLLDHAISHGSQVETRETDALTIHFSDGERIFSRLETYRWSRETGNSSSCIQSALMALELWAHRRVENEEAVDAVIADVLPPSGGPAAYLLVAVDLVLSHWPNSASAAIPFVGCPELLCLDLGRLAADQVTIPDDLGIDHRVDTTHNMSGAASLKARPSRQFSLDTRLPFYALSGLSEMRSELTVLLKQAVDRLGPYDRQANRSQPEFMAAQALNWIDPDNWRQTSIIGSDGEPVSRREYVPPPKEMEHVKSWEKSSDLPNMDDWNMQSQVESAMLGGSPSPEFADKAMNWARRANPSTVNGIGHGIDLRHLGILAAIVIAFRDGDEDLRFQHRGWAKETLLETLTTERNFISPSIRIQSNPVAMAFMGMVYWMQDNVESPHIAALLEAACRDDLLAAPGFRATAVAIEHIDERLPRALLRTAFASCIHSRQKYPPAEDRAADRAERLRSVVDRELGWLFGEDDEPAWPKFPIASPAYRRHMLVRGRPGVSLVEFKNGGHSEPEEELYDGSAARWLTDAAILFDIEARPWLRSLADAYSEWTAVTNGSELEPWAQIGRMPSEWNAAYYRLVAHCVPGLTAESIDRLALDPIRSLPDESFFDASSHFLRSLDRVYFEQGNLTETEAVRIREVLAERLTGSHDWKLQDRDPMASIEVRMGSAVAAFFFNSWDRIPPSSCYVLAPGIPRVDPFLPVLERMVAKGPNGFVAGLVLDLVEVSPRPEHLRLIVAASDAWLTTHPDNTVFWMDNGIGRRLCAIMENIGTQMPHSSWDSSLRNRVEILLSALVALGEPLARQVERDLTGRRDE